MIEHRKIIQDRKRHIELKLKQLAKKSGLVQVSEFDDLEDPRPHISQVPFDKVFEAERMFEEIEKLVIQRI